jgi:uncharacterized hydrophobic protein (TIGR00271 family)
MSWKFDIWISDIRAAAIYEDISTGSQPAPRFYTMVAASSALATLGLMMNSTAVVIGAMLVAPLMTPIFGISLALVRGDARLFGKALQSEFAGVILAVLLAGCMGYLMPELEVTTEMLSRTKPNLLDLLVAVFAGFAGAYAMADENISPALPGVAIATAIVPPLANTGLCISLGAYTGAVGSFLLFFANFLSILLVASTVFYAARMNREIAALASSVIVKRFSLATIGFLVVAALLSKGLVDMVKDRRLERDINATLSEVISHLPASELNRVAYKKDQGKIYCLAYIHASGYISSRRVKKMESALEKRLNKPVELFVRSILSRDVSATGSINQIVTETLDHFSIGGRVDPKVDILKIAEQTIQEYLEVLRTRYLNHVNLMTLGDRLLIMATIEGPSVLTPNQIKELEGSIREKSSYNNLDLIVRQNDVRLSDSHGRFYYEWMNPLGDLPEHRQVLNRVRAFVKAEFDTGGYIVTNINWTLRKGAYHLLVEVTGPTLYTQAELKALKKNWRRSPRCRFGSTSTQDRRWWSPRKAQLPSKNCSSNFWSRLKPFIAKSWKRWPMGPYRQVFIKV